MKILLLGSGGREHALAWKIAQSKLCSELFIAPGNPGTATLGTNISMSVNDFDSIKFFCIEHHINMVVVGPEDPLVLGIWDFFQQEELKHIIVIGPSKKGAQLEGSKAFSKKFMQEEHIPTAAYQEFTATNYDAGIAYLKQHALPIVLKADGLAAGKGVVIAQTHEEALQTFHEMIEERKFGDASAKVVIEEFLTGIECSVFVLSDGKNYCLLPEAKDYKRIGEGDTGLNTGGMGAISPVPFVDESFLQKVKNKIIHPTLSGLQKRAITYRGFIFFGIINVQNEPYVIEYNCRMGDPETEVVMPRLNNDLVEMFVHVANQTLDTITCQHLNQHAATVMLVSGGYPEDYAKGKVIEGLNQLSGSIIFHAGTKSEQTNVVSNGGRVLAVTSLASNLADAVEQSKLNASKITFEGKYYRSDIGYEFI